MTGTVGFATSVYLGCVVLLAVVEGYAIGTKRRGDTISEHFWRLRSSPLVWAVVPLVVWAAYHFVWPWPPEPDGRLWNDLVAVAVGLVFAGAHVRRQLAAGRGDA